MLDAIQLGNANEVEKLFNEGFKPNTTLFVGNKNITPIIYTLAIASWFPIEGALIQPIPVDNAKKIIHLLLACGSGNNLTYDDAFECVKAIDVCKNKKLCKEDRQGIVNKMAHLMISINKSKIATLFILGRTDKNTLISLLPTEVVALIGKKINNFDTSKDYLGWLLYNERINFLNY